MSDDESGDSKGDAPLWNGNSNNNSDSICRDFLRNVCRRGNHCRYRHPEPSEAKELGKKFDYVFCHDFQNKECRRTNCKFLHCTQEEEEYYRATGELPQRVLDALAKGNQERPTVKVEIPVCKDFLKGECLRGGRCRFRHVNNEYENDNCKNSTNVRLRRERFDRFERSNDFDNFEPEPKRRAYDVLNHFEYDGHQRDGDQGPVLPNHFSPDYRVLQEENMMLRRKMEEYKKQVAHLTATNEFLLDQNAQLRLSKQTTVSPVTQTLNPHTITVTPTPLPPPITPISQQLSMNTGDLTAAAQSTLATQRIAPELAAPPPQNIAPMVPVTIAQALAPVSIAPVSIAQAIPAVSLSQSLPQSIITLSSASTSLVSYPIMTQSLRPVIPHSLGH